MKNVTLALDEQILQAGREYARRHHTTLNDLIRHWLEVTVGDESSLDWMEEAFAIADRAKGHSGGRRWKREDLYDV